MYRPSPFLKAVKQSKKSNTTSNGKNDNGEQLRSLLLITDLIDEQIFFVQSRLITNSNVSKFNPTCSTAEIYTSEKLYIAIVLFNKLIACTHSVSDCRSAVATQYLALSANLDEVLL